MILKSSKPNSRLHNEIVHVKRESLKKVPFLTSYLRAQSILHDRDVFFNKWAQDFAFFLLKKKDFELIGKIFFFGTDTSIT